MKAPIYNLVIILLCAVSAFGTTINIPDDHSTIQAGIDASSDGDTVLVQPDTYIENIILNGRNIVLASQFLTTRDGSYINSTIIDGDSSGSVVTVVGCGSTTILCGFTLTNGAYVYGGGVRCTDGSSILIANNNIILNYAPQGYAHGRGGGIYCNNSDVRIENNRISQNYALLWGAGIYCNESNALISNNYIFDNETDSILGNGGGILTDQGSPVINDNTISNNRAGSAGFGGGIGAFGTRSPWIEGNLITGNIAASGAAIYVHDSSVIINNIIYDNQSLEVFGGIDCHDCEGEIAYNIIADNVTEYLAGGIGIHGSCAPEIHHNLIMSNTVYGTYQDAKGGGISITSAFPLIYNNTIINNTVVGGVGGGIYCNCDRYTIFNNIIRGNISSEESQIYDELDSLIVIYSNVQGGWDGNGYGNIDCDPYFCNPPADNFYLSDFSCCVGAGCDSLGNPDPSIHIGAFGIGCYADSCFYIPGDANSDDNVIGSDVTFLVNYFRGGRPPENICYNDSTNSWHYAAADANGDCRLIGSDVTFLVNYFRGQQPEILWCEQTPPMEP